MRRKPETARDPGRDQTPRGGGKRFEGPRLTGALGEHMFDSMDLGYELSALRQSIGKLPRYEKVLDRDTALALIRELEDVRGKLDRLRDGLSRLVDATRD